MLLLTASQTRRLERLALERQGLDEAQLIARAGAEAARASVELLGGAAGKRVLVACGKGNNAADGLTAAAQLAGQGASVALALAFPASELRAGAAPALARALTAGAEVLEPAAEAGALAQADLCIDALVGTGARPPLEGGLARLAMALNAAGRPVLSLDLPSGLDADSGRVDEPCVRATVTLSFLAAKPGLVQLPGRAYVGRLLVADLGVDETLAASLAPLAFYFDQALASRALPQRRADAHKKQAVVLVVAGSASYLGAALLCGRGAYRSGAGLVHLALPSGLRQVAQSALPEAVVHALGAGEALDAGALEGLLKLAEGSHSAVVGPGLGRGSGTAALVKALWGSLPCPSVFDADALHALAPGASKAPAARIVTPHDGEFAALAGAWSSGQGAGRMAEVRSLAVAMQAVVLRKGPATLTARPDGTLAVNATGDPSLASAGTGDVLAGIIAGLLAQGAPAFDAAALAAWAHGRAAMRWAGAAGSRGLLASDLADLVPLALGELEALGPSPTA